MLSLLSLFGLFGGATLACYAPKTRYEHQFDVAGAAIFIFALALIGFRLSLLTCLP